jgi:hypothetical protein
VAQQLDCSRTYIGKLDADGMIQRQRGGFPLDQSRVAYLRYLRREHRYSPPSQADADHVKVKTEMLQMRLMEKRRELVRRDYLDALIDGIAGVTPTALSSMPARFAPRGDPAIRRSIQRVVCEVRTERTKVCQEVAASVASRRWRSRSDARGHGLLDWLMTLHMQINGPGPPPGPAYAGPPGPL